MAKAPTSGFAQVFAALKPLYARHQRRLVVMHDEPGKYYLGTHEVREKDGYRTWFGGVEVKKSYVSAHLIPVYAHPDMLADVSPTLKKRMQGKSCFNFNAVDEELIAELGRLIDAGFTRFEADGRIRKGRRDRK